MVTSKSERKKKQFLDERTWVREFVQFEGQQGITAFSREDLNGVPLILVLETLKLGTMLVCEKCDGPGADALIEHETSFGSVVQVFVHFISNEHQLTIRKARYIREG